jgi:hypothetical protein
MKIMEITIPGKPLIPTPGRNPNIAATVIKKCHRIAQITPSEIKKINILPDRPIIEEKSFIGGSA